ncbi:MULTISPECIES: 30S ribosomal protein S9 [Listeria]|uniref:30S ribosomal protein S9 n=1 Tax=Listeria TaxID=1637 RepID=UPI0028931958|nr:MULTISPECIES: 30S ribosomal protein S9 [Listeria]
MVIFLHGIVFGIEKFKTQLIPFKRINLKTHKKQYLVILNKLGLIVLKNSMKERKKYGLKGARRAPQFSKR